ncbi:L-histidine N(alpha)-methyltransferase [Aminobacter sp. MSH1]|uniref:L-histidine N(alpha)-methyltransferase n=1 Tax=Aminobacter sp. MSH1 TaxID=374606 RepID=UPI001FE16F99|nr:L-histidine N(alpha)-methyltransferase [Aminobacter sp. MSH1]
MNFTQIALQLFTHGYSFGFGAEQYADHRGIDSKGRSMSGAHLWAKAEAARLEDALHGRSVNMVSAEIELARTMATRVRGYVRPTGLLDKGVSVLEFGPGTVMAFREKTFPVVRELVGRQGRCILIDNSDLFLNQLRDAYGDRIARLTLITENIFSGRRFAGWNEPAFMLMFGRTFGNLDAKASDEAPYKDAARTLRDLAKAAPAGWFAVSIGSNLDGERAKAYYEAHPEFQVNVFFRMAAEMEIEGRFNPEAFRYEADIRGSAEFLQVVHTAVLQEDLSFKLAYEPFDLKAGTRFHLKNSFCFSRGFMEESAQLAGLRPVDFLSDGHGSDLHVFAKPPSS